MEKISLQFHDQQVHTLMKRGDCKFVQLSLEPGNGISNHHTPMALTVIVLAGSVSFTANELTLTLEAPDMIAVDPGVEHAITAIRRSLVLLILTPGEPSSVQQTASAVNQPLEHENACMHPELVQLTAPELRPLINDHIELCKLIASVEKAADEEEYRRLLQAVQEELQRHFVIEERVVFPRMALHLGGMDVGPVARLMEEHRQIRQLYQEAQSLFSVLQTERDEHVWTLFSEKAAELSGTLLNHVGKEDSHLFPMASRLFTPEEKAAIAREMNAWPDTTPVEQS